MTMLEAVLVLVIGIAVGCALSAFLRKAANAARRKRRTRPSLLKRFDPGSSAAVSRQDEK